MTTQEQAQPVAKPPLAERAEELRKEALELVHKAAADVKRDEERLERSRAALKDLVRVAVKDLALDRAEVGKAAGVSESTAGAWAGPTRKRGEPS